MVRMGADGWPGNMIGGGESRWLVGKKDWWGWGKSVGESRWVVGVYLEWEMIGENVWSE